VGWWDDMRLVILPFLKENEAMFFVSWTQNKRHYQITLVVSSFT
jgi:hypothetical protein